MSRNKDKLSLGAKQLKKITDKQINRKTGKQAQKKTKSTSKINLYIYRKTTVQFKTEQLKSRQKMTQKLQFINSL